MRWFHGAVVSSFCLIAAAGGAAEPQAEVVQNPYAVGPTAVLGQPVTTTQPAAPLGAWRGTVQPTSRSEPTTTAAPETQPAARTLPNDCLKALRAAVQVRSPAEAYRAADLPPRHDKMAGWTAPQSDALAMRRDEAVKPAAWVEDLPRRPVPPTAAAATRPRLLSDVTTEHQEATRLTRNPYRNGAAATTAGNPLR